MPHLFVYGSLKQGFPNFAVNQGCRVAGEFKTLLRHPFFLIRGQLPCLLPADGSGSQVLGQVFEVSEDDLVAMEALERVGEPGGYRRVEIEVLAADNPASSALRAQACLQDPALLAQPGAHIGPIEGYTLDHARRLAW